MKSTACPRCVWGDRYQHAEWCEHRPICCETCGTTEVRFKAYDKFYCEAHAPTIEAFGQKIYIDDRVPRDLPWQFINLEKWRGMYEAEVKFKGEQPKFRIEVPKDYR